MQKGQISVQTENIFPIIKKFLYSDHEIFLRELIANATDATTKLRTLASKGEIKTEVGDTSIEVILDETARTLTIRDKGIGMTEDEVQRYLNQVAFSSAQEFVEKYKADNAIIGHFGLGFYSAFMVADSVEVITKSWKDEPAVRWTCDGSTEYTIEPTEKTNRGTDIILHISADSDEFLEKSRIQGLLDKYCKFLPTLIQFGTRTETTTQGEGEEEVEVSTEVPNIVNNPAPAWKKLPADLSDEDYRAFYRELYPFAEEPLFWIHLNIDYPFNLTGILYFPKLGNSLEAQRNKIYLYCNQVFVTDDVREIVPEFLMLLHGVIDSPDIPLNVSRSYLQSDKEVKKITNHITKKVADKLNELFTKDRPDFEDKWKDIGVFIKYGILSDEKFADRAMPFAMLQNTENERFTVEEYKEKIKANQTDKSSRIVALYTQQAEAHDSYIAAAKQRGYDVLVMDTVLDNHFMQHVEQKMGDIHFTRIDSDTLSNLIPTDEIHESVLSEEEQNTIKTLLQSVVKQGEATVELKALSPDDAPIVITRPEFMRRFREMQALNGMKFGDFPDHYNVVVNTNHPVVAKRLIETAEANRPNLATHLYQLALLNQGMLRGAELTAFTQRSLEMMS